MAEWLGEPVTGMTPRRRLELCDSTAGPDRPPCPFDPDGAECFKEHSVCTMRAYGSAGGAGVPAGDDICTVCPNRFREGGTVVAKMGEVMLGTATPEAISEIGFLRTRGGRPAGRIDMILCDAESVGAGGDLRWCAVETQSVYFSGAAMDRDIEAIRNSGGRHVTYPSGMRRPDFRSSSAKRLLPQLEIKCPTLRRWGKKTAVVVDRMFFDSLGGMPSADDLPNSDVVWFVVNYDTTGGRFGLAVEDVVFTTLESVQTGLQNASPVSKEEFETELRNRIGMAGR